MRQRQEVQAVSREAGIRRRSKESPCPFIFLPRIPQNCMPSLACASASPKPACARPTART
ncbi:hypothetical protein LJR039_006846 [Pseudorhodoferax sp. LjRoot39]